MIRVSAYIGHETAKCQPHTEFSNLLSQVWRNFHNAGPVHHAFTAQTGIFRPFNPLAALPRGVIEARIARAPHLKTAAPECAPEYEGRTES